METKLSVLIFDIETLQEYFLLVAYNPETKEYHEFGVNKWENNLDAMVKFIDDHKDYYFVGYNNLRFDAQVVEWILRNYQNWHDKDNLEIAAMIAQKAADVIHDANFEVFPEYREQDLSFKQIDLFKLWHFDNKNRMVSLKRLEFEMDLENIEEMPIHHTKVDMTKEEIEITRDYCKNDVHATYEFYKITIGDTENLLYKGKDKIQLRKDIKEEFGFSCLNYSDSKIGDEMVKKFYCQEKKIQYANLPKKGFFRKEIKVKNCIAPYVTFKTTQLQAFHKKVKGLTFTMSDDFKESVEFYGQIYTFAKGGLHSENKPQIFEAVDDYLIVDYDVGSMYPSTIINNGKYPTHLGKEFLLGYKKMLEDRLRLKPLAKKDSKIAGIVEAYKLSLNSVYGKSSDMQSWIYDRQLTMFTTITGELSLLMLIESYELNGISVISANTDGITIKIKKELLPIVEQLNEEWCKITKYELERTDYTKIIFSTVNDYIAIKPNGEIKKKGDFVTDFELHKNKSGRIIPIALEEYFINDKPVADTIRNHRNIFDFAMRQRANKDFHFEGKSESGTTIYNKLIRFYVSNTGEKLLKVKNLDSTSGAAPISQVEAGEWVMTVCNHLTKDHPLDNINHSYYIERAERIINKIDYNGKKRPVIIANQLTLW